MRQTTFSTGACICIVVFSLAIWPLATAGQNEPTSTAAASNPSPTATATPDNSLKGPQLIATVVSDIYAPQRLEDVGPASYPSGINPLTGLPYPNEEARERRNLIVKVSNWPPKVRPQHAINQADLVFEMESEGGVTRFAAMFRSNAPQKVGSVRSARLVDMELLTMYAALLAYSGTSGPVRDIFKERVNRYLLLSPSLGDNCEEAGFCRDESVRDRGYEHTLFGDTRHMWEIASRRDVNIGFRAVGFAFDLQPDTGGRDVKDIYINWYDRTNSRWQFEGDSERYLRYSDGAPHYDAADDTQLWADNLVLLQVAHNRRPDLFEPGAINESYEVALWGSGPAYVMRDGLLYRGYWNRANHGRGAALSLNHRDGQPIMLKPGRTWVTVMRSLDEVELSDIQTDMSAAANANTQADT